MKSRLNVSTVPIDLLQEGTLLSTWGPIQGLNPLYAQSVTIEQLNNLTLLSTWGPTAMKSRLGVSTVPIDLLEEGTLFDTWRLAEKDQQLLKNRTEIYNLIFYWHVYLNFLFSWDWSSLHFTVGSFLNFKLLTFYLFQMRHASKWIFSGWFINL